MTHPQQPTWTPPPPPPRRSAWDRLTGWQKGAIVGGAVLVLGIAGAILAPAEDTNSDDGAPAADPSPAVPDYIITGRDEQGMQTNLDVEVTTTDGLRAVFDDVIADLDQDGGYFVQINCTTGATSAADNRLANGRYAVGNEGAAATGLEDGASDFEPVEGARCPAD